MAFSHTRHSRTRSRSPKSNSNKKRGNYSFATQKDNGRGQGRRSRSFGSKPNFRSRGGFKRGGRKIPTFNPAQFINKNPVELAPEVYVAKNKFSDFALDTRLVSNVAKLGMETPSPIQDQIIPEILKGNDVIGLAETGTGKTAAFLLPLIEKTLKDDRRQALILAPTRELAIQIEAELKKLSVGMRMYSTICVGGVNIQPQIRNLRRKTHFVIGTPGRILDLLNRGVFKPSLVTTVVLDEADRMLDMGFITDIKKILGATPKERETLFFSATTSKETDLIVKQFLKDPVTVSVKKKEVTNNIEQDVVAYSHNAKFEKLLDLFQEREFSRVLIFGAMKHSVKQLAQQLNERGVPTDSIHGNKTHNQRQRALNDFKSGKLRALVATDVAARGIHVDNVSHVINYDLPNTLQDYVHRIGRTGRGNKRGKALTFVPKS